MKMTNDCRLLLVAAVMAVAIGGFAAPAARAAGEDDAARMGAQMMNPGSKLRGIESTSKGEFKVLIYGNSIALHAPKADIGWTNYWGMAASSPEKDFAHLVIAGLEERLGKKAGFRIRNLAVLERNFTTDISTVAEIKADAAWSPDYVVIAIGENSPNINASNEALYRKFLADVARPFAALEKKPKIVLRSPFWYSSQKAKCTEDAAKDVGAVYVDAGHLGSKAENKAIGIFSHRGVANHPGDLGMRRLADLILSGFAAAANDVSKVLEPMKPGEIVARGWLREQLELSLSGMGGHLGEIEPDQMDKPYITRNYDPANGARGIVGWCAEMGGEYALSTAMLAYAMDDPALIEKTAARIKAAMALQEPDGYLGAYRPSDNRQEDYNAWGCHWFYNAMLLEYYRTGDKAILDAIHRGLLWFVRNWNGEKKTDYAGPTIIEPASVVYKLTGDRRLLEFCEEYAKWLDRPGHKNGATFTKFPLTRNGYHVAAIAARLKAPAALAYASGRRGLLDAVLKSHHDFYDGVGWQATYVPCADGEWTAAPSCVGETEYCDYIFYQELFVWLAALTGDTRYADATERLVFNGAQGARAKDERTIGYMTSPNQWQATLNSSRWGPEPFYHIYAPNMNAACCPANSFRLYPHYVMRAVFREGRDLRVMNYGPYEVRAGMDGKNVRIVSETDYPFGQRITLRVSADGWKGALRLRRPVWAESMSVKRGGKECSVAESKGVVTVAGPWRGEEKIVIDFDWRPVVRTLRDRDFVKEPLKAVEWGALVFAQPVAEKWVPIQRPNPTFGQNTAPPQPKEWPWFAIYREKEPTAYALPRDLKSSDIQVRRIETGNLPWQNPPVRLLVPMVRASAAYPPESRKGRYTPLPAAGVVTPDAGAVREAVELVPFGATCLRTTCFPTTR